jgi:hypothetical protein
MVDGFVRLCAGTNFAKLDGDGYMQRCNCGECWLAVVAIVATELDALPCFNPPHSLDPTQCFVKFITIRSSSPAGTTLSIPFTIRYIADPATGCGDWHTSRTLSLKVGVDTGGRWRYLRSLASEPTEPADQPTWRVYIASVLPTAPFACVTNPNWCSVDKYAMPLKAGPDSADANPGPRGGFYPQNPGPVKYRELMETLWTEWVLDCSTHLLTPSSGSLGAIAPGVYDYSNDTSIELVIDPSTDPVPDVGPSSLRCFNVPVFSLPAGPIVADVPFNLDVTYTNPFTCHAVDGTHHVGDDQEEDIDTDPTANGSCPVQWSSITRLGFGHYRFNNFQILKKGLARTVTVWANFQHGTFAVVNAIQVTSGAVAVVAGTPSYVDVIPPTLVDVFFAGQVITVNGGTLTARILDGVGASLDYNVVDTATNTVALALSEPGTNYLALPSLGGTTSVAAVSGIALFPSVMVHGLGRNYSIDASSPGLGTSSFNGASVFVSIATNLAFEALPTIHAGVPCSIKVDMVDYSGAALVPTSADALTLSGAGSFSGFGSVTPVAGVATFSGTFPAAGTYAIQVVTSGTNYDGPGVAGLAAVTINVTVLP